MLAFVKVFNKWVEIVDLSLRAIRLATPLLYIKSIYLDGYTKYTLKKSTSFANTI